MTIVNFPSRRRIMKIIATSALVAGLPHQVAAEGTGPGELVPPRGVIDVHHHIFAPGLQNWLVRNGVLPSDRAAWPNWAKWDAAETLDVMEMTGMKGAVVSQPAPLQLFPDADTARRWTRVINEAAAEVCRDHPKTFGFFAYLPLNHPDVAIEEAAYALDVLRADGVMALTHSGATSPGHPDYADLLAELDRRRTVLFLHPHGLGLPPVADLPEWLADFPMATTRAALSMLAGGVPERYSDLAIILTHAGGFLPYIHGRILDLDLGSRPTGDDLGSRIVEGAKRLYFETVLPMSPHATETFLRLASPDRILFGSDWPERRGNPPVGDLLAQIARDPALDGDLVEGIASRNARKLFPRFA